MGQITTTTKTNSQMSSTSLILLISATVCVSILILPRLSSAVPDTMFCHKCSYTDLPPEQNPVNMTIPISTGKCRSPDNPPDPPSEDDSCTEYEPRCVTSYITFQLAINGFLKKYEIMHRDCSGRSSLKGPHTCIRREYEYTTMRPIPNSTESVFYRRLDDTACYCQDTLYCNNEPGNMTKKSIRTVIIPVPLNTTHWRRRPTQVPIRSHGYSQNKEGQYHYLILLFFVCIYFLKIKMWINDNH